MLSIIAQRAALRLPAFSGSLLLRSRATPIVLQPVATRTFGSTPWMAFPKAATKTAAKETKSNAKSAKKTTAKKPAAKTRTAAKKKATKKPAKKAVRKPAKKEPKTRVTKEGVKIRDGKVVLSPTYARPKGPVTTFNLFYSEFWKSQANPSATLSDAPKLVAAAKSAWEKLSASELEIYKKRADEQNALSNKRLEEWSASLPYQVRQEINKRRVAAGKKKIRFNRLAGTAKPVVHTPYIRWITTEFIPKYRQENPTKHGREMIVAAAAAWKALPAHEKQPLIDAYKREKAAIAEQEQAASS